MGWFFWASTGVRRPWPTWTVAGRGPARRRWQPSCVPHTDTAATLQLCNAEFVAKIQAWWFWFPSDLTDEPCMPWHRPAQFLARFKTFYTCLRLQPRHLWILLHCTQPYITSRASSCSPKRKRKQREKLKCHLCAHTRGTYVLMHVPNKPKQAKHAKRKEAATTPSLDGSNYRCTASPQLCVRTSSICTADHRPGDRDIWTRSSIEMLVVAAA